jgi:hypothetical protein
MFAGSGPAAPRSSAAEALSAQQDKAISEKKRIIVFSHSNAGGVQRRARIPAFGES